MWIYVNPSLDADVIVTLDLRNVVYFCTNDPLLILSPKGHAKWHIYEIILISVYKTDPDQSLKFILEKNA